MLVYSEAVLIAQYSFETTARCLCLAPLPPLPLPDAGPLAGHVWPWSGSSGCGGGSGSSLSAASAAPWAALLAPGAATAAAPPGGGCVGWLPADARLRQVVAVLGLHAGAGATLPLFLCYLATLMLNYSLASQQPEQGLQVAVGGTGGGQAPHRRRREQGWLKRAVAAVAAAVVRAAQAVAGHLRCGGFDSLPGWAGWVEQPLGRAAAVCPPLPVQQCPRLFQGSRDASTAAHLISF